MRHYYPLNVIAGLTRNLLSRKGLLSFAGDGGCSSAMTVMGKGLLHLTLKQQ